VIPEFTQIKRVRKDADDVRTIFLDKPGFSYEFGQFNMLYAFGKGEVPISISGYQDNQIQHTIRSVGAVSDALCQVSEGDFVGLRGPFGSAWPQPQEKQNLFIVVGGIGLAPLTPTIEFLYDNRENYGQSHLVYGARSPKGVIFQEQLSRWNKGIQVHQTVDVGDADWAGDVGNVTQVFPKIELNWPNTEVYTCGPEVMMRFTVQAMLEKKVPEENIHLSFERNMKCAIGHCGHCQFGPKFMCKDGPVFSYAQIKHLWKVREL